MTAEKLLELWEKSCKINDDCDECFFAEICSYNMPINQIETLTAKEIKSFVERAEEKFGKAEDHFLDTKEMAREDHHSIAIMLDEGAKMPTRAHDADAGYDICSRTDFRPVTIDPGLGEVFDTGVHISIPRGYVGFLKSKSGLNVKHGIVSEGVIDSGYTGSIRVKLYNHGIYPYTVQPGDKISQLVILPIITPELEIVDSLGETERGDKGFGSSGR